MSANGKAPRPVSWQEFVGICILEKLSIREASIEALHLLNYSSCRMILGKYGLALTDSKTEITETDIADAIQTLVDRGLIIRGTRKVTLTSQGHNALPDISLRAVLGGSA